MKTLQLGKSETLTYYRRSPDDVVSSVAVNTSDVGTAVTVGTVVNDPTSVAVAADARAGAQSITLAGTVTPGRYCLRHNPATIGPDVEVEILSVSATYSCGLKMLLGTAIPTGTLVKGIKTTVTVTVPSTITARSVVVKWTLADGTVEEEEYFLAKYLVRCPLTTHDLPSRWSKLKDDHVPLWQRRAGVGWTPQIETAWEDISLMLLENSMFIHNVRNPEQLKPLLWTQLGYVLLKMGLDPAGAENREEQIRSYQREVQQCLFALKKSQIWIDYSQTNTVTTEATRRRKFRMGHERHDDEELR